MASHRFVNGFIVTKYFLKIVRLYGLMCKVLQRLQLFRPKIHQIIAETTLLLQNKPNITQKLRISPKIT